MKISRERETDRVPVKRLQLYQVKQESGESSVGNDFGCGIGLGKLLILDTPHKESSQGDGGKIMLSVAQNIRLHPSLPVGCLDFYSTFQRLDSTIGLYDGGTVTISPEEVALGGTMATLVT
ncbi:hypothetical protein RUM44_009207 [Polyplax serrata]|uniref:Uncharacterized protein n=1 Tax=Polyplax serrata TaxID=468196 RepID=A0ABR1AS09_POLSC